MQGPLDLHRLAQIDTHPHPTLSLYLALDQSREGRLQALGRMLKAKEQQMSGNGSAHTWRAVAPDAERVVRYVEELPLGPDRGLVLFSCQARGVFLPHTLPLVVPNLVAVGPTPYIRPLAALAGDHGPTLVVVLDRRRARFLEGCLGQLRELEALALASEPEPRESSGSGARSGDKKTARRAEAAAERLYKQINARLMERMKQQPFAQLLVGGAKAAVDSFTAQLHPYLAQRLTATFSCDLGASPAQIGEEVERLQPTARRRQQERLLKNLSENLGPGGKAATGLNQVLAALHGGQVHTLFVRRGYTAPGGVCPGCGRLRHLAGTCPLCGEEMTPVEDVVNLAIARAIASGAALEQVEGSSELDRFEDIAALLRYA